RVGIIDRGKIVAEGTPTELKAAIGRPSVEAIPQDPGERERLQAVLHRFGDAAAASQAGVAARLPEGVRDLAEIVRTLDAVCLAKTGRSLEGAGDEEAEEERSPAEAAKAGT